MDQPVSVATSPPVLVEVTRGAMVESRHRGSAVVARADGTVVAAWGEFERPVYARSAIKPLQAIALVESGAADAFELSDQEIALACASHGGEADHVALATAWLERLGLSVDDLECGPHMPSHDPSAAAMIAGGQQPTNAHNNCSGKHTGMLTTALHKGEATKGYVEFSHPVQQRILGILEQVCGLELGDAPRGVDGCSIPTIGIPLGNLALGMARFVAPDKHLPEARAAACRRIAKVMVENAYFVAGTGRFCTACMTAAGGKVVCKTGAEGVYMAALPETGLGIALKIEDGGSRASEAAMAALLREFGGFDDAAWAELSDMVHPKLLNRRAIHVGDVGAIAGWPA